MMNFVVFLHYLTWAVVIEKQFFQFKDQNFDS